MKRGSFWLFALLIAFSIVFVCQCADEGDDDDDDDQPDDDDDFDDPLEEGRYWLQAGEPERARMAFERAFEVYPDHPDAHYGIMLSGGLHLWELLSLVSTYLIDAQDGFPTQEIDPNRELLRVILEIIADGYFSPAGDNIRGHAAWLEANGDPAFIIDNIPVMFMLDQVAGLGSEFDVSERQGCLVFGNLFDGLGGTLISLQADFSLSYVFTLMDLDFGEYETLEIVSLIVDMIDRILHDPGFPNTFRIDPDYIDRMAESRLQIGSGLVGFKATLDAVRAETDPQDDDVLGYEDLNGSGHYDEGDPFVIPGLGPLDEQDMALTLGLEELTFDLGAAMLDRTELDLDPGQDNPFHLSSINKLLEAFDVPPIIPDFLTVDVAAFYEDLNPDSIRDLLQMLVNLLQPFLPEPPDVF